jgi:CubicO group peptidase (beta-lactamase class C family)
LSLQLYSTNLQLRTAGVERVSGKRYAEFLKEKIFDPLGIAARRSIWRSRLAAPATVRSSRRTSSNIRGLMDSAGFISSENGATVLEHGGDWSGYRTHIIRVPRQVTALS